MTTAEKRADLQARGEPWPDCECHDTPMLWQRDQTMSAGGYFKCRIVNRRQRNEWRAERRAEGVCVFCGDPAELESRCRPCADAHADHMAQPYQQLKHRAAKQKWRQKVRADEGFQPTGVGIVALAAFRKQPGS